nr:histone H1.10-like [Pogona vitticeps]
MTATPGIEMRAQELMTPTHARAPLPRKKVPGQNKKRVTCFTEGPTVITRSMQKKKDLLFLKSTESLPNISRLLVRALATRESNSGLTFAELKEMLGTKGYDVTRHCPDLKRKLNSLVSKGALVRMTHQSGSMFFVVRKYPEKASEIFGNSDEEVGTEKAQGVDKRKATRSMSPKMKGGAQPAKSPGQKTQEGQRSLQNPGKKLQPREKQSRQSARSSNSAKRFQSISSTSKRSSPSNSKAQLPTKRPHSSNRKAASSSEGPRKCRRQAVPSSSKRARSTVCKITAEQSRCSSRSVLALAKEQGSPYGRETRSTNKIRCCQSRNVSPPQEQRSPRRKAPHPTKKAKNSRVPNTTKRA